MNLLDTVVGHCRDCGLALKGAGAVDGFIVHEGETNHNWTFTYGPRSAVDEPLSKVKVQP